MIECDVPADKQVFYRKQFNKLIVNVIQKIKPFNLLKKTETFVSYYTLHDVDISNLSQPSRAARGLPRGLNFVWLSVLPSCVGGGEKPYLQSRLLS